MIGWATNPAKLKQYLMLLGDAAIVIVSFVFGLFVHSFLVVSTTATVTPIHELWNLGLILLVQSNTFFIFTLYDLQVKFTGVRGLITVTSAVITTVLISSILSFYMGRFGPTQIALLIYTPITIVGAYLWRRFFFNALLLVRHKHKLALVGVDKSSQLLRTDLEWLPVKGYEFVGTLCEETAEVEYGFHALPVYPCTAETLPQLVEEKGIDTLVYSLTAALSPDFLQAMLRLRLTGLEICDFPAFYSKLTGKVPVYSIDTRWVLQVVGKHSQTPILHNSQRCVETIVALAMFVLAAPFLVLIALAIKIDSRGSVFFKQERLGLNQKPFVMFKFRTMIENAEVTTGPTWTHKHDPRVTRVGQVLRKTGLDELPQLLNIIKGDMGFVGFRPIRKYFADILAEEIPYYHLRFMIRPGVTGWPQVCYDYAGSKEGQLEKFQYELFYLQNFSLLLDIFIIIKTLQKSVLRRVSDVSYYPRSINEPEQPI